MMLVASAALLLLCQDPPTDPSWKLTYKGGLRLESPDDSRWARLNGRWMHDWGGLDRELRATPGSTNETRRARLLLRGELGPRLGFRAQGEFKGGDHELLEWMLDWKTPEQPSVRIGHFREPFSLDARTSSAHLTFLERSAPTEAFAFGRNQGIQIRKPFDCGSWALGLFREADGAGAEDLTDNQAVTGRLTWVPSRTKSGDRVVHLGIGASFRDTESDGVRLAARPEAHLATEGADTGLIAARRVQVLGLEGAIVRGPFSTQAEAFFLQLEPASGVEATLRGGYIQASWMLTGEHHAYRTSTSSFGPVAVRRPVLGGGGMGAWELGTRLSRTDLDDASVQGGTLDNLTVGLTWHLNGFTRCMLNYVRTSSADREAELVLARLHVGF